MTAQSGSLLLLKVGNGGTPETFTTIGGLRTNSLTHNNQTVDATHRASGAWREIMDGAGIRAVSLSGSGVFTDSAAEESVRGFAMNNQVKNYQITFGNGDALEGPFHIVSYQRAGTYNSEEIYFLTLLSAGPVTFTSG